MSTSILKIKDALEFQLELELESYELPNTIQEIKELICYEKVNS